MRTLILGILVFLSIVISFLAILENTNAKSRIQPSMSTFYIETKKDYSKNYGIKEFRNRKFKSFITKARPFRNLLYLRNIFLIRKK